MSNTPNQFVKADPVIKQIQHLQQKQKNTLEKAQELQLEIEHLQLMHAQWQEHQAATFKLHQPATAHSKG